MGAFFVFCQIYQRKKKRKEEKRSRTLVLTQQTSEKIIERMGQHTNWYSSNFKYQHLSVRQRVYTTNLQYIRNKCRKIACIQVHVR